MIYVKTQMQRMPKNCRECAFYMRAAYTEGLLVAEGAKCRAKGGYTYGKNIGQYGGRPKWCPLRESEEQDG